MRQVRLGGIASLGHISAPAVASTPAPAYAPEPTAMDRVAVTFGEGCALKLSPNFTINSSTLDFDQRPKPPSRMAGLRRAVRRSLTMSSPPAFIFSLAKFLSAPSVVLSHCRRPQYNLGMALARPRRVLRMATTGSSNHTCLSPQSLILFSNAIRTAPPRRSIRRRLERLQCGPRSSASPASRCPTPAPRTADPTRCRHAARHKLPRDRAQTRARRGAA
jgi:hypothetical protein